MHPNFLTKILRLLPSTLYYQTRFTALACSKSPWGLLFPLEVRGMLTAQRFHRTKVRDSGNLVASLVQAGNKPARYYATMRASELGPLFTSAYSHCTGYSRTGSEQRSAPIHTLTGLQGPVFLINSRTPFVTATRNLHSWHPLYLRYRANLPNSLDSITPIRLSLFS